MKRLLHVFFVLLFAVAMVGCSQNEQEAKAQETKSELAESDSPLYDISFLTLDGETLPMAEFKGEVVLVDFWDTWCPPCRMEIPHFIELYDEYNDEGFELVGVAFGRQGKQAVIDFGEEFGINYHNTLFTQEVVEAFGGMPRAIPTTYLVDRQGNIIQKYEGYKDKEVFEADIKAALSL